MPDGAAVIDDLCGELLAALALDRGPVLTVPLPPGLLFADVAAVAEGLSARAGPERFRALHLGADVVAVGIGRALEVEALDDIVASVGAARARRCVVAVPFSTTPPSSPSPWVRHRGRVGVVPRLWLHHRDGASLAGIDLGDDTPVDRSEARALLLAIRRATGLPAGGPLGVDEADVVPDVGAHADAVAHALGRMAPVGHDAPDRLEKLVLARRRRLRVTGHAGDLALDLWRATVASSPDEVRYLIAEGGDALVGVSPERLCRRRGHRLEVDVLAGTGPLERAGLLEDDKERREHEAVRRFVVDALRPLASALEAPTAPGLRRLRGLQHLSTPVRATLVEARPVFAALHPTPAVAGVPRGEAMAGIAALEGFDRGLYAGVVGIADADGEDLQVALRCAHVRTDDDGADVDLYAGSGLVPGSVAGREWAELDRKEATMRAAIDALVARRVREVSRGAA